MKAEFDQQLEDERLQAEEKLFKVQQELSAKVVECERQQKTSHDKGDGDQQKIEQVPTNIISFIISIILLYSGNPPAIPQRNSAIES